MDGKATCNTHTAWATKAGGKADVHTQKAGTEGGATCTQLCEVEVTPPMNSVGLRADSNRLKISEPSMSFSPDDGLV